MKNIFWNEENLFLFRMSTDEKINKIDTNNLKSIKFPNFRASVRNIIKKGKQYKLFSFINFLFLTFDFKNCKKLIR